MSARWAADPTGVFTHRYWDGTVWTDQVAIDGRTATSPVDATPEAAAQVAASLRPVPPPPGALAPPPPPPAVGAHMHARSISAGADSNVVIAGRPVSSLGRRFLAYVLDFVLVFATCGIGWVIWAIVTATEAQTRAKRLMQMQCVNTTTGRPLDWATFVLLRGGVGLVGGFIAGVTIVGYLVYLLPFFNDKNQHFYGMMTDSTYVDL